MQQTCGGGGPCRWCAPCGVCMLCTRAEHCWWLAPLRGAAQLYLEGALLGIGATAPHCFAPALAAVAALAALAAPPTHPPAPRPRRNPLVSFVYERGWRQGFAWAGFPGADAEFDIAMDYLAPGKGGVLLDMSCGSGLFTRKFAASGAFSGVIAADFSETMLQQTQAYLQEDRSGQTRCVCGVGGEGVAGQGSHARMWLWPR
jgi:hypothetical protein